MSEDRCDKCDEAYWEKSYWDLVNKNMDKAVALEAENEEKSEIIHELYHKLDEASAKAYKLDLIRMCLARARQNIPYPDSFGTHFDEIERIVGEGPCADRDRDDAYRGHVQEFVLRAEKAEEKLAAIDYEIYVIKSHRTPLMFAQEAIERIMKIMEGK